MARNVGKTPAVAKAVARAKKAVACLRGTSGAQFLATVPEPWRVSNHHQQQTPSCPQHWTDLAEVVWGLYPHRSFDQFVLLVQVYAPYSRFNIATLGESFRENCLREAYLALQQRYGTHIDVTPLPQVVIDRITPRDRGKSKSAKPRTKMPPATPRRCPRINRAGDVCGKILAPGNPGPYCPLHQNPDESEYSECSD
jgi:hypothetical protein